MNSQKKLIAYASFPDFSDNPRGLFETLKDNPHYDGCWIIEDKTLKEPLKKAGVSCVVKGSQEADDLLKKADIVVSSAFDFAEKKRDGQIYLSTWHGFPLKTIGFLEKQATNPEVLLNQKITFTKYDMVLAPSKIAQLFLSSMFAMDPRKFYVTGYPRNDILLKSPGKELLHELFPDIPSDAKTLFYLPTMRKGLKKEGAQFEDNLFNWPSFNIDELDETLEKHNLFIIVKPHFADNKLVNLAQQKLSRVKVIDTETLTAKLLTIYHLLSGFDGLITDYSSIYTDFILLDKPIFFNCPDLATYKKERGFVTEDPTLLMPGPLIQSQEDFGVAMANFANDNDAFQEKRRALLPVFQQFSDAKSGERTVKALEHFAADSTLDADKYAARFFSGYKAPLISYANEFQAQIFYSEHQDFSDEKSQIFNYQLDAETGQARRIWFNLDIPSDAHYVRLDPDSAGFVVVSNLTAKANGKTMRLVSTNGEEIDGKFVFGLPDPQMIFELPRTLRGEKGEATSDTLKQSAIAISLSFDAENYLTSGLENIVQGRIHSQLQELKDIKASKSWQLLQRVKRILKK